MTIAQFAPLQSQTAAIDGTSTHVQVGALHCHPIFAKALSEGNFRQPTLLLAPQMVAERYRRMSSSLFGMEIYYAVKANPAPEIIAALAAEGSSFDVASMGEIYACLASGIAPDRLSFGNVVKHSDDIQSAFKLGVNLFAADSEEELEKLARYAPNCLVFIRLLIGETQAEWPLSDKSGCSPAMALDLLDLGNSLGLNMVGISFHVGSQTRAPEMWETSLKKVAQTWHAAFERGHALSLLNIGGGFPAPYGRAVVETETYCSTLSEMIKTHFGNVKRIIAEPGRGLVAEAGLIVAEVLLCARKDAAESQRWVYLNIGKFSGLAETMDEAIKYKFVTPYDGMPTGPCIVAGPSCDSVDVLYRQNMVEFPFELKSGDTVLIEDCGAYTTSYSSVGFNGFPPLKTRIV